MTPILIAHLDADCFYVSAERVRSPHIRGLPVGVLGNQGACVIAKSYEAKAAGVKTGMPIWDAFEICPDLVYVKRDFEWYETLSRKMLSCVREDSLTVEYYSIDEFFFEATLLTTAYQGTLLDAAKALQQRILQQCGVPVSVGVAPTKTLAKLASDCNKPFGCQTLTTADEINGLLQGLPVQELCGVASRSAKKLANHGITTCDEFVAADSRLIRRLLTVKGEQLWYELHGQPCLPIVTNRPMHKHLARGGSLGKSTSDKQRLYAWLARNVERLVEALRNHNYVCRTLALDLSYKKHIRRYADATLCATTNCTEVIMPAARELFHRCYVPQAEGSYMHVIAGELQLAGTHQSSFLTPQNPQLDRIKGLVNDKCGRFAVRSAATVALYDVYHDESQQYDICDVQGKSCF